VIVKLTGITIVGVAEFRNVSVMLLFQVPGPSVFLATPAVMVLAVALAVPLSGDSWSQAPPVICVIDAE
jgi:hypothetical protein